MLSFPLALSFLLSGGGVARAGDEPTTPPEKPAAGGAEGVEPWETRSLSLSAFWIPVLSIDARFKVQNNDPPFGIVDLDVKNGSGFGVRAGVELGGLLDLGLLYTFTEHHTKVLDSGAGSVAASTHLDAHAGYVELLLGGAAPAGESVQLTWHVGVGAGFAYLDFNRNLAASGGGLALEGRASLGVRLFEHLELRGGGGAFVWQLGWGSFSSTPHGFYPLIEAVFRF